MCEPPPVASARPPLPSCRGREGGRRPLRPPQRLRRWPRSSARPSLPAPIFCPGNERAVDGRTVTLRDLDHLEPERLELGEEEPAPLFIRVPATPRLAAAQADERACAGSGI